MRLKIKQFVFNFFQENTFVVSDESGNAVIIDPGCYTPEEEKQLQNHIHENHLRPAAILLTHGHIDHIIGVPFCTSEWGIPLAMHPGDRHLLTQAPVYSQMFGFSVPTLPEPAKWLSEEEFFQAGNISFQILHVPGHSPGGIALYAREGRLLFAGDILFNGSVGRSDLPGGDHDLLIRGIRQKLLSLPGETLVWPGHGPSTSIEAERIANPFLQ